MLNKRDLLTIRKALPKDGYKRVADKTGYDSSTVGRVLREPKHFNALIINAALVVIEEYKKEISLLKNQVKQITS